jgi:hypothetical protein
MSDQAIRTADAPLVPSADDLPSMFRGADQSAIEHARHYTRSTWWQLVLLIVAAVAGAFTLRVGARPLDWAGLAGAAAFVSAAVLRADLLRSTPERNWYNARAAAESVKTLAWRYAVAGAPFGAGLPDDEADELLLDRLRGITRDLPGLDLAPDEDAGALITPWMQRLRGLDLEQRKLAYDQGRAKDQQEWYARKAKWNRGRVRNWNTVVLTAEALGAGGAMLKATGAVDIDLLGISGALVAGATAWLQARQHENQSLAYGRASFELAFVRANLRKVQSEQDWGRFVDGAEESISREHTLWRASQATEPKG